MRPVRRLFVASVLLAVCVIAAPTALAREADAVESYEVVVGTGGPDVLVGSPDRDLLRGWSGDDRLMTA